MSENSFLIYGANGYSGELIARHAKEYGLQPVLAGRKKERVQPLATQWGYEYRIFDVHDKPAMTAALKEVKLVLNTAGPFQFTATQLIEACLETHTHYLDINGDIAMFELMKRYDAAARQAGIMVLPGVGFDVVPTDCLALYLKEKLPGAVKLQLAFATLGGGLSHGTATTMANKLGEGGAVRKAGKIVKRPLGEKGMWVDFGIKKLFVMTIPWGDIATAYTTTGIPDIESYTGIPRKVFYLLKGQFLFNWLLRTGFVRKAIKRKINKRPAGPSDQQRAEAVGLVWGKASDASGRSVTARFSGPEGYSITTHAALIISKKVLSGDFKTGYLTPALAYGKKLILEVPGVTTMVED